MAALNPPPGLPARQALFVLAGTVLVQVTTTRLGLLWTTGDGGATPGPAAFVLAFLVLPALACLAWIWLAAVWREPAGWQAVGLIGRPRDAGSLGVLVGGGTVVMSLTLVALLAPWLGEPRGLPLPVPLDQALGDPAFVLLFVVAAVFIAPLAEEILFRGVLYGWLRQRLAWPRAALLAAMAHALLHGDPAAIPALTAVFFVYAWCYERRGSLWAPLIAHAAHNAIILLLTVTAVAGSSG